MHRASETIGNLAAALAKAQLELANPLEDPDRHDPISVSAGGRSDVSLCLSI